MIRLALMLLILFAAPASGTENLVNRALNDAIAAFEKAAPRLGRTVLDIDVAEYGDALTLGRFTSTHWGGAVAVEIVAAGGAEPGCQSYAAFVRLPPRDGIASLVICPEFSTPGTGTLRRLTMLHEFVHIVAGPDECRAMAFAARVEYLALGHFTPVERYWQANDCAESGFSLP